VIIDGIRLGTLSSDLFTTAIWQAMGTFPKSKNLGSNELFSVIGRLNNKLKAIAIATTGRIPE
jgi:hypothetical protein